MAIVWEDMGHGRLRCGAYQVAPSAAGSYRVFRGGHQVAVMNMAAGTLRANLSAAEAWIAADIKRRTVYGKRYKNFRPGVV